MPSSADAARGEVVRTIIALEKRCLDADAALVEHRWGDVAAAFRSQSELTDRLAELFAGMPESAPANDHRVAERLHGVVAFREAQLRRLCAYRDEIGRRLSSIGKVRALSRSIGTATAQASFVDSNV